MTTGMILVPVMALVCLVAIVPGIAAAQWIIIRRPAFHAPPAVNPT
jgi:hypothetical protein